MAPHFVDRVKLVISSLDMPFVVREVILSNNPFFSVSQGCCLAAQNDWKRSAAKP